jgi:hypothetical protein
MGFNDGIYDFNKNEIITGEANASTFRPLVWHGCSSTAGCSSLVGQRPCV